jgi:hypothetical protein
LQNTTKKKYKKKEKRKFKKTKRNVGRNKKYISVEKNIPKCPRNCQKIVVGKRNGFGFNHKIMIKVQELQPSIMITWNLWSARV